MATPAQRRAMVHRWFSMDYVAKAFIAIRDSEFETVQKSMQIPLGTAYPSSVLLNDGRTVLTFDLYFFNDAIV